MKRFRLYNIIITVLTFTATSIFAQDKMEENKCGSIPTADMQKALQQAGDHWGYGYDSLLNDLERWEQSEWAEKDSIGRSVLDRPLWRLTITDPSAYGYGKRHISIHARTHPGEVQSTWVTNEIIDFLLSDDPSADLIRRYAVFHIVPMYNPDGVELEYPRENSNGIDLESNWYAPEIEKEVLALRASFQEYMDTNQDIELALNMHSAYACKRYFVYHHENGTSVQFTRMQKELINSVRDYSDGFEPWNYYVSWSNGTPYRYPESWWWVNYNESVLAITYEDMNCESAGNYKETALAILKGSADYLDIELTGILKNTAAWFPGVLGQNYPNPVSRNKLYTNFPLYTNKNTIYSASLYSLAGKQIRTWDDKYLHSPELKIEVSGLKPGIYFLRIASTVSSDSKKFIIR